MKKQRATWDILVGSETGPKHFIAYDINPPISADTAYILRTAQQKPNNQINQRILFHRTKRIFQNMFVEQ